MKKIQLSSSLFHEMRSMLPGRKVTNVGYTRSIWSRWWRGRKRFMLISERISAGAQCWFLWFKFECSCAQCRPDLQRSTASAGEQRTSFELKCNNNIVRSQCHSWTFTPHAYNPPVSRNLVLVRTRRLPLVIELCPTIKMKNTNNSITLMDSTPNKLIFKIHIYCLPLLSALIDTITSQNWTASDLLTQPQMVVGWAPFTPLCHGWWHLWPAVPFYWAIWGPPTIHIKLWLQKECGNCILDFYAHQTSALDSNLHSTFDWVVPYSDCVRNILPWSRTLISKPQQMHI